MKNIFTVLILLIICINSSFAQKDSIHLQKQITSLSKQIGALNDTLNIYKNKIEHYETIDSSISLIKEITSKPFLSLIKYGLIPVCLMLLFFGLLKKVKPDWYTVLIQRWIEKYEKVNVLKSSKNILVVSSKEFPNEKFVRKLFEKKNFKKVSYCKIEELENEFIKQNYPIIFANNLDGNLDQVLLEKAIESNKYSLLFYYGNKRWDTAKYGTEIPEYLERINMANSPSQVYGNLLSALEYHETLI